MRNVQKIGIKPKSTLLDNPPSGVAGCYFPMVGGGTAAINISAVTKGNPTLVRLGSAPAFMPGQYVKVASAGGMTELNGYHRVLYLAASNTVVLDVDSTGFDNYTSGGSVAHNVLYDAMGTLPSQDWSGTVTGLYANQLLGTTPHTGGTNTGRITSPPDVFDLTGFTGILYVGGLVNHDAGASGSETLFSVGRRDSAGANSASGTVSIGYVGAAAQLSCTFRPATASDGTGTNAAAGTGSLTNGTTHHAGWLIDCRDPSAPVIVPFLDAIQKTAASATMTNATGLPNATNGIVIGATLNTSLAVTESWGALTNVPKLRNWAWLKLTSHDLGSAYAILKRHSLNKELVF
jgi:hypothetical protein